MRATWRLQDGSGSHRSAVCLSGFSLSHCCVRGAASAVCVPSVRDWCVFFKEIGPPDRQNDKNFRLARRARGALRRLARLAVRKAGSFFLANSLRFFTNQAVSGAHFGSATGVLPSAVLRAV
jgi:hypothetical protein